jgi:hypothetical protein
MGQPQGRNGRMQARRASEEKEKDRDGQKGRIKKVWGGGEVIWAIRVPYEVESGINRQILIVRRLAQQSKPIRNDLKVTM